MSVDYYVYKIQENNLLEQFRAPLTYQVGDTFKWVETLAEQDVKIIDVKVVEINHQLKTVFCKEIIN